jgi:hypothetical protein
VLLLTLPEKLQFVEISIGSMFITSTLRDLSGMKYAANKLKTTTQ